MVECDWDIYIDMLSESYPGYWKEPSEIRDQFWNSDKVNTCGFCIVLHLMKSKYCTGDRGVN